MLEEAMALQEVYQHLQQPNTGLSPNIQSPRPSLYASPNVLFLAIQPTEITIPSQRDNVDDQDSVIQRH